MPKTKMNSDEVIIDLLQKLLITQLANQGVSQNDIARIVGVGSVRVNSVVKKFNSKK